MFNIPKYIETFLSFFNIQRRVSGYAQLTLGEDLSEIAPNEYGCAESVTRLINKVDSRIIHIITGTWTLWKFMKRSKHFIEIEKEHANNGVIVIAPTGTGHKKAVGHVGILIGDRVYSNNSYTGKWSNHWTLENFISHYEGQLGIKVRYFAII